jgi:hypothetical protein
MHIEAKKDEGIMHIPGKPTAGGHCMPIIVSSKA